MAREPAIWFLAQLVAITLASVAGRHLAHRRPFVWKTAATLAALLAMFWPLMRFFPAQTLAVLGSRIDMLIEVTGMAIPVALLFTIALRHFRRDRERRLVPILLFVCVAYFVRSGLWMVRSPVPDLGRTEFSGDVCLQTTGYTCVAASLVTLLKAHGIDASETEMARLSHTEVNYGATDSRALYALEQKLDGQPVEIHYETMDYDRLRDVTPPCVVPTNWGYFISHMVPVLAADERHVILGDPLQGPREMTVGEFRRVWKRRGIYLTDKHSQR